MHYKTIIISLTTNKNMVRESEQELIYKAYWTHRNWTAKLCAFIVMIVDYVYGVLRVNEIADGDDVKAWDIV